MEIFIPIISFPPQTPFRTNLWSAPAVFVDHVTLNVVPIQLVPISESCSQRATEEGEVIRMGLYCSQRAMEEGEVIRMTYSPDAWNERQLCVCFTVVQTIWFRYSLIKVYVPIPSKFSQMSEPCFISFDISGRRLSQIAIICSANGGILSAVARSPTSPAYANVMPTILFQVSRWANVYGHHLVILIVQRYLIFLILGVIG